MNKTKKTLKELYDECVKEINSLGSLPECLGDAFGNQTPAENIASILVSLDAFYYFASTDDDGKHLMPSDVPHSASLLIRDITKVLVKSYANREADPNKPYEPNYHPMVGGPVR